MKTAMKLGALLALALFATGCTQEAQLDDAMHEMREERTETQEQVRDATQDNVITTEERGEIREEQGETAEQAGEVSEEAGDVIEKRTDQ